MCRKLTPFFSLFLSGCAILGPQPEGTPDLQGTVRFGTERSTQATLGEIGTAATVSLIDAYSNLTIRTALTDSGGHFQLSFGTWKPSTTSLYYLEAIKGLGNNQVGKSAARVRTVARFQTTGWQTISSALPGSVTVNYSTTALSAIMSLVGTASVDPANLIGKLTIGTADNSLSPATPDTFTPTGTGITNAQFHQVYGLVDQAVLQDTDPINRITYTGGSFFLKATGGSMTLSAISPTAAPVGAVVTVYGSNFSLQNADNVLSFNGATTTPSTSSVNQLTVTVPVGASTGNVALTTPSGTASLPFTVITSPSGQFTAN